MTRKEMLQIRKLAHQKGGQWPVGKGFVLMALPDGRVRLTGNGGSSYFPTYRHFYRWVQAGAPTRLGPLCRD
jgi:hypothetical protein